MSTFSCAVSIDLDEIPHYFSIHGLRGATPSAASAVYDVALTRILAWAAGLRLPLTLFVVGADLNRPANARALQPFVTRQDEFANHSFDHPYDWARRTPQEQSGQISRANQAIEASTGARPVGFRAPGYAISNATVAMLTQLGFRYDSSLFPCPAYYLGKASTLAAIGLRGRRSASVLGDPRALLAPTQPYRIGSDFWRPSRENDGLWEIPIQVTRYGRWPFLGTTLTWGGVAIRHALLQGVVGCPVINLELHGIDFLDVDDGLRDLCSYQPGLSVPHREKIGRLTAVVETLQQAAYALVRLRDLAP